MNCTVLEIPADNHEPFNTTELLRVLNAKTDSFVSNSNTFHYLHNHDQERTIYRLGSESSVYDDAAFRRIKLGASLLLTAPGMPMLWMGEEFGQASECGEYTGQKSLDSSLLNNDRNRDLWEHYRHLIALRKDHAALCSDHFDIVAELPERCLIAFKRWDDEGNVFLVVVNLIDQDADEFELVLEGISDAQWHEVLWKYDVISQGNSLKDTLGASEVKIYQKI